MRRVAKLAVLAAALVLPVSLTACDAAPAAGHQRLRASSRSA